MAKSLFYLTVILFLLTPVFAELDPADKVYIESQHQKTVAQTNAKMDANTQRIQESFFREIAKQKQELSDELGKELRANLKSVVVGLAGMIIVTLGVFKIIDMRFTSTRGIKKYEDELKKKTKELDEIIHVQKKELDIYRETLSKFAVEQGFKPIQKGWKEPEVPKPPKQLAVKKSFKRRAFPFIVVLGVIAIAVLGYFYFLR